MPLYEYECTACHKRTEKIQKFSDPEITLCPKCGGVLERVITAPAIAFKGGGWYADGYGNAKPSGGSSAEAASTDSKPASDGGGTESKAAPDSKSSDSPSAPVAPAAAPSAPSTPASKA